jgi:hypothetical protein
MKLRTLLILTLLYCTGLLAHSSAVWQRSVLAPTIPDPPVTREFLIEP